MYVSYVFLCDDILVTDSMMYRIRSKVLRRRSVGVVDVHAFAAIAVVAVAAVAAVAVVAVVAVIALAAVVAAAVVQQPMVPLVPLVPAAPALVAVFCPLLYFQDIVLYTF